MTESVLLLWYTVAVTALVIGLAVVHK